MRVAGFALRVVLLVVIFVGVGLWAAHLLIARAVAQGTPEYDVRLAGYMGGLFLGGAAATVAGVVMLLVRRRDGPEEALDEHKKANADSLRE